MGDLTPNDQAVMKRRLQAERDAGGRWILPVGPSLSYADGSLGVLLAKKGYTGAFVWTADPLRSGRRMVELLDADDESAWTVGDGDES